ncbi:MAG: hypothetical protein HQL33_01765 [Alphaproteobacteria bacterium]|nr:hypothetical protein [Alphaproteobacteria bacterium]
MEHGAIKEYISIRFRPTREQRQVHEAVYAQFRQGTAKGLRIEGGAAVPIGWRHTASTVMNSLAGRISAGFAVMGLAMALIGWMGASGAGQGAVGAAVLVGLLLSALLGYRLFAAIQAPLKRFETHFDAISRRNFTHEIDIEPAREFSGLTVLLRAIKAKLAYAEQERRENEQKAQIERQRAQSEMADHLEGDAREIHRAAEEMYSAVETQAATSSEMSASVAEITATMEELSASANQVDDQSKSVVSMADRTWQSSKVGAEAMQAMLERMEEIHTDNQNNLMVIEELGRKSKEISRIMQMIESVADKTKLIAFNAALEASSAGEAGKRFGVVASEIRRLADSVTDSAGEIAGKVGEIQDSISNLVVTAEKGASRIVAGMGESNKVAEMLAELEGAAYESSTAAQQISLATQQQRAANGQVVVALREIANASTQTADSISRISEVALVMTSLSDQLETLVGRYQLRSPADRAVQFS